MFQRSARVLLVAVLLVVISVSVLAADTGTKQVGLVIAFPDGTQHVEIVTVPEAATTFDVLSAAKISLVSQSTSFGPAVCSINNVGCPADNCFCDPKQFWAYFHLQGDAWAAAAEGAGSYVPGNGSVEGFAWSGSDSNFNPTVKPAVYTFDQIAAGVQPTTLPVSGGSTTPAWAAGLAALLMLGVGVAGRFRVVRS